MLTDICAACDDGIVFVAVGDQWFSATAIHHADVCPATDGPHEPSLAVG